MRNMQISRSNGIALMIGAATLWGTIGIATQAIYNIDDTSSLFINLARMLVASPFLFLLSWKFVGRGLFDVRRRDYFLMALQGILLTTSHACYFVAIRYSGVSIATLITLCLAPVIVSGVSVLFKLEAMTKRLFIALGAALLGTLLLVGFDTPQAGQADLIMGTIFAIFAAASYGGSIVTGRILAATYNPLQITALSFAFGTAFLFVINLFNGFTLVESPQAWLLLLYLGLVPTALAYWLFQIGLRSVSATAASILSIIELIVAALLAWILFGETLAPTGIIGAGLLILSIFLLSVEKSK